jgi:hypothetical protein
MSNSSESIFSVLKKLMDESVEDISTNEIDYQTFANITLAELSKILDDGSYIDNANIIRRCSNTFEKNKLLIKVPELVGKTLFAIFGTNNNSKEILEPIIEGLEHFTFNNNIPHLILPLENNSLKSEGIYALNYCDKLVPISSDDYKIIGNEFYRKNIEARKLIKLFISFHKCKHCNEAYIIMPPFLDETNNILESIKSNVNFQVVLYNDKLNWKRLHRHLIKDQIYFVGSKEEYNKSVNYYSNGNSNVNISEPADFYNQCELFNKVTLNVLFAVKLEEILLDVRLYYISKLSEISVKLEHFNNDLVNVSDNDLLMQLKVHRNQFRNYYHNLNTIASNFNDNYSIITNKILEYDSKIINNDKLESSQHNLNIELYSQVLLRLFFKHITGNLYSEAYNDIVRLNKINYPYKDCCSALLKVSQGQQLSKEEINLIRQYPDDAYYIAKIKLAMNKELGLINEEVMDLMKYINDIETGEEFFYSAKWLMSQNEYDKAKEMILKSLEFGYKDSHLLLEQYTKECGLNIDLELLASFLIPEASFKLALIEKQNKKYKKANVYFKVAASQLHIGAIEYLANELYEKYIRIPYSKIDEEKNQIGINNLIELYNYLYKKYNKQLYELRIGLMYNKIQDYGRAYQYLSSINDEAAIYACARMLEYGNGVAKDLNQAKRLYDKIIGYKDAGKRYNKVDDILYKQEQRRNRSSAYSESKSYRPEIVKTTKPKKSSGCYVITATCKALKLEDKRINIKNLIKFRNIFIHSEGNEAVSEYYRLGPTIVNHINTEEYPNEIYEKLWNVYIDPSLTMIEYKKNDEARDIYISMCKMLCQKYNISVQENIKEKYLL